MTFRQGQWVEVFRPDGSFKGRVAAWNERFVRVEGGGEIGSGFPFDEWFPITAKRQCVRPA